MTDIRIFDPEDKYQIEEVLSGRWTIKPDELRVLFEGYSDKQNEIEGLNEQVSDFQSNLIDAEKIAKAEKLICEALEILEDA